MFWTLTEELLRKPFLSNMGKKFSPFKYKLIM